MIRDLSLFKPETSLWEKTLAILWKIVEASIFRPIFVPKAFRVFLLLLFGANVSRAAKIRNDVRILFPWKLKIGQETWIGEGVWIINHQQIEIGSNVCISQGVTICSSSHDFRTSNLAYKHSAIYINDGAWICLKAIVLAGSKIGNNSVISAGEVFAGQLENDLIYRKGSSKPINYQT